MSIQRWLCLVAGCMWALCALAADDNKSSGKSFYRWQDTHGRVHYADRLPPEQSALGSVKYTADGISHEVIEGAKTAEQVAAETRLKRLRAELERLWTDQAEQDQALLRTFRNEEEVHLALEGNLAALDAQDKVITLNLERQQAKLGPLQNQASELQKQGKPLPPTLKDNLDAVQRQITNYQSQLSKHQEDKQHLREKAERDAAHLRFLKAAQPGSSSVMSEPQQGKALDILRSALSCRIAATCQSGWRAARAFVNKHNGDKPLVTDADRLIRTEEPLNESDIALWVGRLPNNSGGEVLFLDLRCLRSSGGAAQCNSDAAWALREGFRRALESAAGLTSQQ